MGEPAELVPPQSPPETTRYSNRPIVSLAVKQFKSASAEYSVENLRRGWDKGRLTVLDSASFCLSSPKVIRV